MRCETTVQYFLELNFISKYRMYVQIRTEEQNISTVFWVWELLWNSELVHQSITLLLLNFIPIGHCKVQVYTQI